MLSHVWTNANLQQIETLEFCRGRAAVWSHSAPPFETPNEDSLALFEMSSTQGVMAVADGMGGANAGDQASRIVIDQLHARLSDGMGEGNAEANLRAMILDGIEAANREVLKLGVGAGATVAVIEFSSDVLRMYHVGDSTAMLFSNRGRIKASTVAHAPVAMAVELGVIPESEALHHEDRNLITNCVGSEDMKIEIGPPVTMAPRDTLIVGSDGLFDNMTTTEIVQQMRTGPLKKNLEGLVDAVQRRMEQPIPGEPHKPDDLTILAFRRA